MDRRCDAAAPPRLIAGCVESGWDLRLHNGQQRSPAATVVVIVDDDALVAAALARVLLRARHDAQVATGAAAALEHCARCPVAVIISDYRMPGRDGLWLLLQVRERYPGTFRILCSGTPPEEFKAHLASGLVQRFVSKPVCPHALLDAVAAGLG